MTTGDPPWYTDTFYRPDLYRHNTLTPMGTSDQRLVDNHVRQCWHSEDTVHNAAPRETVEKMNGTYTRRLLRDARDAITEALTELENK